MRFLTTTFTQQCYGTLLHMEDSVDCWFLISLLQYIDLPNCFSSGLPIHVLGLRDSYGSRKGYCSIMYLKMVSPMKPTKGGLSENNSTRIWIPTDADRDFWSFPSNQFVRTFLELNWFPPPHSSVYYCWFLWLCCFVLWILISFECNYCKNIEYKLLQYKNK